VLVLAGPGAGKTFCLIERIRHLIEVEKLEPAGICAFTFTNKAAEEIATRLEREVGAQAAMVKRSTLHAFCVEVLREFHEAAGLPRGFGIADEDYQRTVLSRLGQPSRWHTNFLQRVALHRFLGYELQYRDKRVFERYEHFLRRRDVLDFDQLVIRVANLLELEAPAAAIRGRWSYLLVDEFQDLNPVQYRVVRALVADHGNVFAVGDDEQSIYSWAGAEPKLFNDFANDYKLTTRYALTENRRCPRIVFDLARRLVERNPSLFNVRKEIHAPRESSFEVRAVSFPDDESELAWLIADLVADRELHQLPWGDFAILYRKHRIGNALEGEFLKAGIPCRLAQGRALADDPVVRYVLAALRVVARTTDSVHAENFLQVVLPSHLFGEVRARSEERGTRVLAEMERLGRALPKADDHGMKIRRGLYALRNLPALGAQHSRLGPLIEELLSHRVGVYRSMLEDRADEITDPAEHAEVVRLAERIDRASREGRWIAFEPMGGIEIALAGMVSAAGLRRLLLGRPGVAPETIAASDAPVLGVALGFFKALQVVASRDFTNAFTDFTAVDLETTGRDIRSAGIVEIAAVRVRGGQVVDEFHSMVKPSIAIEPGASVVHKISMADLEGAPTFEDVWPAFAAFIGTDVLVAHNGYAFDFPVLRRMARELPGGRAFRTYDTLPLARELHTGSRRLVDLADFFGVAAGTAHRALDDTRMLAHVFNALSGLKIQRARKAALSNLLDHLGIALALTPARGEEAERFADWCRPFTLGRYGEALDWYRARRDAAQNAAELPPTEEVIERLGGVELMLRIRAEKSADQRYPIAMARLRRLIDGIGGATLAEQIDQFVEQAVLSRHDGVEADRNRVNLLTLHSTTGLEFSRVYIVGVEDAELLKGTFEQTSDAEAEEARRLLYVGMTRTMDRLTMTRAERRGEKETGGYRFLVEMGVELQAFGVGRSALDTDAAQRGVSNAERRTPNAEAPSSSDR
jgi:DNA polymerase III epsilon subunit family exonuclease